MSNGQSSGSGGVRNNNNRTNNNRKKNNYYRKKNYNKNTSAQQSEPLQPKIKPRTYTPKKKQLDTFTELQYTDKVVFVLGGVTLLMSIAMWFMGYREEASYLGIWVPGIFSAGTFIRFSLTRAKRK